MADETTGTTGRIGGSNDAGKVPGGQGAPSEKKEGDILEAQFIEETITKPAPPKAAPVSAEIGRAHV